MYYGSFLKGYLYKSTINPQECQASEKALLHIPGNLYLQYSLLDKSSTRWFFVSVKTEDSFSGCSLLVPQIRGQAPRTAT